MKTSLLITTYNWKEALKAVLDSVKHQSCLPDEVIVADDGSRQDTGDMIAQMQTDYPVPLLHSWQEDAGFRATVSRNRAIASANGDYLLMIDGDMVLSQTFVECHKRAARPGWFVQAGRVQTNSDTADKIMKKRLVPSCLTPGIGNRKNCITNPLLSRLFSFERKTAKGARSCNMSFWKEDALQINGFNHDFVGWGREDNEFVCRLLHAGKRCLCLKFAAVGYHLYHAPRSREALRRNDAILEHTMINKLSRCPNGIDSFL